MEQKKPLTPREKQVLSLLITGETQIRIAEKLGISYHTIKTHVSNIYEKINARNNVQALLWTMGNPEKMGVQNAKASAAS